MIENTGTDSALGDSVVRITDHVTTGQYIVGKMIRDIGHHKIRAMHSGVTCIK